VLPGGVLHLHGGVVMKLSRGTFQVKKYDCCVSLSTQSFFVRRLLLLKMAQYINFNCCHWMMVQAGQHNVFLAFVCKIIDIVVVVDRSQKLSK
jgi:hypothetical protein